MTGKQQALNSYLVGVTGTGLRSVFLQAGACHGVAQRLALSEPHGAHSLQLAFGWLKFKSKCMCVFSSTLLNSWL